MTQWCQRGARAPQILVALAALVLTLTAGCGGQPAGSAPAPDLKADTSPTADPTRGPSSPAISVPATPVKPAADDPQHLPFTTATRDGDNPPADAAPPPDTTVSKKSAYKLYKSVSERWDSIRFKTPEGKKIEYTAVFETDLGKVRIALFPEAAPNHVRNFVALIQAGYYDDLMFELVRHEVGLRDGGEKSELRSLEGGCPLGTGEAGSGSIGYWLKDEFKSATRVPHEEGTIGACRSLEADSAACRFYLTLTKTPILDGNYTAFGKVVEGLDVVRKIYAQPVIEDDQDRDGLRRPVKPVVIRKATVVTAVP